MSVSTPIFTTLSEIPWACAAPPSAASARLVASAVANDFIFFSLFFIEAVGCACPSSHIWLPRERAGEWEDWLRHAQKPGGIFVPRRPSFTSPRSRGEVG